MDDFLRLTNPARLREGAYILQGEITHVAIVRIGKGKLRIVFLKALTAVSFSSHRGLIGGLKGEIRIFKIEDNNPDNGHVACKISSIGVPESKPFSSFEGFSLEFLRLDELPSGECLEERSEECRHLTDCTPSILSVNSTS